jgi:hypothetical protein
MTFIGPKKQGLPENPGSTLPENANISDAPRSERTKKEVESSARNRLQGLEQQLNIDTGTLENIKKLNFELPPSPEQQGYFESLQSTLITVPQALLHAGISAKELMDIGKTAISPEKIMSIRAEERAIVTAVLAKLGEMRKFPDHLYSKLTMQKWPEVLESAQRSLNIAKGIVSNGKSPDGTPDEKSLGARALETMKANPKMTMALMAGAAVGSYFLVKKLFGGGDEKKENSEKSEGDSTAWKWTKRLLLTTGVILGVGSLLEVDGVKKFAKDTLKIDVDNNRIYKALTYLSFQKFDLKKFWETLTEGDPKSEVHKKIAKKISEDMGQEVSPETLALLEKEGYDDFTGYVGQGLTYAGELSKKLKEKVVPSWALKIAGIFSRGNDNLPAEEKVIRAYLEKHQAKVNEMPKNKFTTVTEVLAYVSGEGKTLEEAERTVNPDLAHRLDDFDTAKKTIATPEKLQAAEQIRTALPSLRTSKEALKSLSERATKRKIPTEDLQKLYTEVEEQQAHILNMLKDPAVDADALADQGDELGKAINRYNAEQGDVLDQLSYHEGWNQLEYLAFTQSLNIMRGYFTLTPMMRNWVRARTAAAAKFPLKIAGRAVGAGVAKIAPVMTAEKAAEISKKDLDSLMKKLEKQGITNPAEAKELAAKA